MRFSPSRDFECLLFEKVSSTMDVARSLSEGAGDRVFAVLAREQLAGRGRKGRRWMQAGLPAQESESPDLPTPDSGEHFRSLAEALASGTDMLPFTVAVPASRLEAPPEWVSLLVGCAIHDALAELGRTISTLFPRLGSRFAPSDFLLKWPNDLLVRRADGSFGKVCGILCETSVRSERFDTFFLGVGINLFAHPGLDVSASFWDWLLEAGANRRQSGRHQRNFQRDRGNQRQLLERLGLLLAHELQAYLLVPRSIGQLRDLVMARTFPVGTSLLVEGDSTPRRFLGLNDKGGLLLEGRKDPVWAGDVSVAPVSPEETEAPSVPSSPPVRQTTAKPRELEAAPCERALLALDCGNTRMHWALGTATAVVARGHISNSTLDAEIPARSELAPLLAALSSLRPRTLDIPYASVAARQDLVRRLAALQHQLRAAFPNLATTTLPITSARVMRLAGLAEAYDPSQIGVDRALRFLFATSKARRERRPVAMIAAGTALTLEVVDPNGGILESGILPGLQMSFDALARDTAALPRLEGLETTPLRPDFWTTRDTIQRGFQLSLCALVAHLVDKHRLGAIVLSGGNSSQLKELLTAEPPPGGCIIEHHELVEAETLLEVGRQTPGEQASFGLTVSPNVTPATSNLIESMRAARTRARHVCNLTDEKPTKDFRRLGFRFEPDTAGQRFDRYLANRYRFHNRDVWTERILAGEVRIQRNAPRRTAAENADIPHLESVKPTYRLHAFDQIWLFHPPSFEPAIMSNCEVLRDDGDAVVFCKPGNLVIHAVGQYSHNTFLTIAAQMGYANAAPVHRIDRETSGILVCARQVATRNAIAAAFRDGTMRKMYLALTRGGAGLPENFRVTLPIGSAQNSQIRLKLWVGGPDAQSAETWCSRLATDGDYVLWACMPQTGRTNQIRIHLAAMGAWIVGDKMYHPDESVFIEFFDKGLTERVMGEVLFPRHMLHNACIQGPEELGDTLGRSPVICPLPPDLMDFPVLLDLLDAADLGRTADRQQQTLASLFERLHAFPFQDLEPLSPPSGV